MEINFSFTVLCDKDHLKKLQHLLIDEEYDDILDVLASESEYEIQDFKGEVVDPNKKINTITVPYKQGDSIITIPTVPCDGTAPLYGFDHLYRPDQIKCEMNIEPTENTIALYTDTPIIADFNTPDNFHYSSQITPEELEKTKDLATDMDKSFDKTMKNIELRDEKIYNFGFEEQFGDSGIQCNIIGASSLAEAIRWYESTNEKELVYYDVKDECQAESIKIPDNDIRINEEGTYYFFHKRDPQFYYVIKNDHNLFYTTIKSDLTGKDIITFTDSIEKADHFEFIQQTKEAIDDLSRHNEECQGKDFVIIKCAKRIAEIYCGEGRIIRFNEWHYKYEGGKNG